MTCCKTRRLSCKQGSGLVGSYMGSSSIRLLQPLWKTSHKNHVLIVELQIQFFVLIHNLYQCRILEPRKIHIHFPDYPSKYETWYAVSFFSAHRFIAYLHLNVLCSVCSIWDASGNVAWYGKSLYVLLFASYKGNNPKRLEASDNDSSIFWILQYIAKVPSTVISSRILFDTFNARSFPIALPSKTTPVKTKNYPSKNLKTLPHWYATDYSFKLTTVFVIYWFYLKDAESY